MKYHLEGKVFRSLANSENGEVGADTVFYYHQQGDMIWADYSGGQIKKGHLMGKMLDGGLLELQYHHVNTSGQLMAGTCTSTPEHLDNGKIKFKEEWQWHSGDQSSGYSEIIEV